MMPQPPPSLTKMVLQSPSDDDQHIIPNTNIVNGDQDDQSIGFLKNGNNHDYAKGMMMMNSFMPSNNMIMTMMMNNSLNGFENDQDNTTTTAPSTSARMFFPMDDLKPTPTSENEVQLGDSNCNAYWSGGGSPWTLRAYILTANPYQGAEADVLDHVWLPSVLLQFPPVYIPNQQEDHACMHVKFMGQYDGHG
ncbi:hypothetical protein Tco_1206243 [Tanacetum coccineum]